jgi:hypothetical protein
MANRPDRRVHSNHRPRTIVSPSARDPMARADEIRRYRILRKIHVHGAARNAPPDAAGCGAACRWPLSGSNSTGRGFLGAPEFVTPLPRRECSPSATPCPAGRQNRGDIGNGDPHGALDGDQPCLRRGLRRPYLRPLLCLFRGQKRHSVTGVQNQLFDRQSAQMHIVFDNATTATWRRLSSRRLSGTWLPRQPRTDEAESDSERPFIPR